MSCCSNLKERCLSSKDCLSSSWGSALADMERRAPGMDMDGMKEKAGTGDMGETADREEKAETEDREALRPRRSSNSRNNDVRNIRRDGGHDHRDRDRDRRDSDDNDDNDDASSCQPPDETSSARASRDRGTKRETAQAFIASGDWRRRVPRTPHPSRGSRPALRRMPSAALIWGCSSRPRSSD